MKLIEYLQPLQSMSQQRKILAVMYYLRVMDGKGDVSATEIRAELTSARVPGSKSWNISARLGAAGASVHATGAAGARRWELTETGEAGVLKFAPELVPAGSSAPTRSEAATLRRQVSKISDAEAQAFASEAVDCLQIGAHRAAIVFMWVAATHEIQERLWAAASPAAITAAAQVHNPKAKVCKKRDDLGEINENLLLQVAHDLGVIDKNQKTELIKALDLRNGCGHPNKLRPGEHRAKAHIEDLITMLF